MKGVLQLGTNQVIWQIPPFRCIAELFNSSKVKDKLSQLFFEMEISKKLESYVKEIEKYNERKLPKSHFKKLYDIIYCEFISMIEANVATKIIMEKKAISEKVICEELTPWIITSAIAKIKVQTSQNPRIYLIKLWKKIK